MADQEFTESNTRARLSPVRILVLAAAVFLLSWLGLKAWRVGAAVRSLMSRQDQASQMLSQGVSNLDPDAVEQLVSGSRQDVLTLITELQPFVRMAPYFEWLPWLGDTAAAAPHMIAMADAGTQAGVFAFEGVKPILSALQEENGVSDLQFAKLIAPLEDAEPELIQAGLHLDAVIAAREQITDVDGLPRRIRTLLEKGDEWLPLGAAGLEFVRVVPELAPLDGTRHYLIVAQNEDEMRPTGGFISAVGIIIVDQGNIADLDFQDAYDVDDWQNLPYELPPQPLLQLMGLELFLFRDANFWPDFPTSALAMMELYRYGQSGENVDGVIAVDQRFVQMLLEATGPIQVATEEEPLDSSNIIDSFRESWSFQGDPDTAEWIEWYRNRKAFVGTFALSIMSKFQSDFSSVDPMILTKNMFDAANQKHLQIYVRDPAVASVLMELGWDGRLQPGDGRDFLMVVDTNVGYSKANIYIDRSIDYQVDLSSNAPEAQLSVNYLHAGSNDDTPCQQDFSYDFEVVTDYLNLANRCYWNYLRVYTPAGSQLVDSSQHEVPVETLMAGSGWEGSARMVDEANGVETFANFMVVPRGSSVSSRFDYMLPATVVRASNGHSRYELHVLKQAGMGAETLTVTVNLPDGAQLLDALPAPSRVEGQAVHFDLSLDADLDLVLEYR